MFESALQDVRYSWRLLRGAPVFTATAAVSLAIGIGANTTIFSVASAMLLRPLPGITEPGRLVDIGRTQDGQGFDNSSYPNFRDIRARVTTLSGVYVFRLEAQPMGLGGSDGAERIYGTLVSANYFTVLGTAPVVGRLLVDDDDRGVPGEHAVMVISYELWQRRFGGDPRVIGQTVPVNGRPFAIVGVTPRGFQGTTLIRSDAWLPIFAMSPASSRGAEDMMTNREAIWLLMGGRLKPGVTREQANAELQAIGRNLEREYPEENRGKGLQATASAVVPGHIDVFVGFLALLMGMVGLVLLIACVNLSGMLLARAAARRREIAVRVALGASPWRLARQMFAETSMLFIGGSVLGVLLSVWLRGLLLSLLPALPVPVGLEMPIDLRVLTFAVLLSVGAGLFCGLSPALHAMREDLVPGLKADSAQSGGRIRGRHVFLVGQIALSLLLVLTAGLFVRTLMRAASVPTGFDQTNVDLAMLDLSLARYTEATGPAFASNLVSRIEAESGIEAAALAADLPLDGGRMGFGRIRTPGLRRGDTDMVNADWNVVSPGYFRTLGIGLLRGRDFSNADTAAAPRVAIVNEAMARTIWSTPDAIGRSIEIDDGHGWRPVAIVGVASNARVITLDGPLSPYIYVPLAQRYTPRISLLVKSADGRAIPRMRSVIRQLDVNLPITQAMPLQQITALGLIPQRIASAMAGSLGIVGLLLAAIGIYGVTSYNVNRRTREIAIRVALGADGATVLRFIFQQGLTLTAIGVVIGLAAGAFAARLLQSLLFGIRPVDPTTFIVSAALFVIVALAATIGPARRAARVDPIIALRAE